MATVSKFSNDVTTQDYYRTWLWRIETSTISSRGPLKVSSLGLWRQTHVFPQINVNSETSLNTNCIVSLFNPIELWSIAWSVDQLQYILKAK